MGEDRCVCCGQPVPEGTQVCPSCMKLLEDNKIEVRKVSRLDAFLYILEEWLIPIGIIAAIVVGCILISRG